MPLTAKILVLACALVACQSVGARMLKQTASTSDFTSANGTYLVSTTIVSAGTTANSADECLQKCASDSNCAFWSWCPDSQSSCSVPAIAGGSASTVPAKGCVLSYDETKGRQAMYSVKGSEVMFQGGQYNPSNTAPAGAAANSSDPASYIDPNGTPSECTGFFSGNQWSGDEIECHVCNGDYQLKCDLDTDIIGDDSVKCEFDRAGAGALINNAVEFSCNVDNNKVPQNQCDWASFDSKVPACAVEPVRRIMASWRPDE